jgi:predicted GNAT superfamily acetyltransferase
MDRADVEIRPLEMRAELDACVALQEDIWGEGFADLVPPSLLKVVQRIGGTAAGAFDADGRLLGFVFGMTGVEGGRIVHWSDMLAVRPEARNAGVGRRLKEHQRKAAREVGAEVIYWTFDPLVARNAHLNFNRFGVVASAYVEDMYGVTASVLHGGLPTDRLIVAWSTRDDEVTSRVADARRALDSDDCADAPLATARWLESTVGAAILPHCVRVEVPSNAESMILTGADDALRWRLAIRRGLQWGLAAGYAIAAFKFSDDGASGYYLLTRSGRFSAAGTR